MKTKKEEERAVKQSSTARQRAIQIISSLAEEEEWEDEYLDRASELIENEAWVDTIVGLKEARRGAWIQRKSGRLEEN